MGGDLWSILGSPVAVVVSFYLVAGAMSGVAAGVAGWLLSRVTRARPARFSWFPLIFGCGVLFATRSIPSQELFTPVSRVGAFASAAMVLLGLGFWWACRPERPRSRPPRTGRALAVMSIALACALTLAWVSLRHYRIPIGHRAPGDAPNVIFVLVDALRADRLSISGYGRPTTPNIDRLASRGTVFSNAYSHGNRTIIAMPSVFTSKYPSYARKIKSGDWSVPLPDSQTTLAEIFRHSGYATFALMSNPFLKRPFGLTQGFARVEEFNEGRFHLSLYRLRVAYGALTKPQYASGLTASATEVTDAALEWLTRVPSDAPFFCYAHYMDVHHPYLPPATYEQMFNSNDRLAQIDPAGLYAKTVDLVREKRPYPLGEDELARLSDLYDGCIRYVDSEIARLVDAATVRNGRPTVVIITSDHGDEFQEHGLLYHNNVVIEELIRVPLVIWRSDGAGARRVDEVVRHIDILPTLAEWIGAAVPAGAVGRSLVPLLDGNGDATGRSLVAEGDYCSAVVETGWKLMRVDTTDTNMLFNLAAGPGVGHNVALSQPERHRRMLEALDLYFEGVPLGEPTPLKASAATLDQLKTLGYVH